MRNFSPVSAMKKSKDPVDEFWREIRESKQTWRNTKIIIFAPIIVSAPIKAVSLQLNGMFMMWKIRQAMQDDAIRAVRIHTAFIPVTGMTCLCGKIFGPTGKTYISGTKPARPLIWTRRKFYKAFRGKARSRKPCPGARFSKVPVTAWNQIFKSKHKE